MGMDIHFKTYVWLKDSQTYVDAAELVEQTEDYLLQDLFSGRNYDIFGLFGETSRTSMKSMSCWIGGLPPADSIRKNALFSTLGEDKNCCWFGFNHAYYPALVEAIDEYLKDLANPIRYYASINDEDTIAEYRSGDRSVQAWLMDPTIEFCKKTLIDIRDRVLLPYRVMKEKAGQSGSLEGLYGKYIDVDKTVFVDWFDC